MNIADDLEVTGDVGSTVKDRANGYTSDDPYAPGYDYPNWQFKRDVRAGKGRGNSKGYDPNTWRDVDRGRYRRRSGARVDSSQRPDDTADPADSRSIGMIGALMELGGATPVTESGYGANKSPFCRYCGKDLGLPRDEHGLPVRRSGGQREYCAGDDCERQARNARRRRRRARRSPKPRPVAAVVPDRVFYEHPTDGWLPITEYWAADPLLSRFRRMCRVNIGPEQRNRKDPVGELAVRVVMGIAERPEPTTITVISPDKSNVTRTVPYTHMISDDWLDGQAGIGLYRRCWASAR